ncbi:MAG: YSC84-related protein [Burkholderiaceae bacterium]|jgi:lipid-binding SYLF domain-containing protein|nr:YSC84-related protein [Burkholderiaceae bacterium]
MKKRTFLLAGASAAAAPWLAGCTTTAGGSSDPAARRKAIDSDTDRALGDLYRQAAGSRELVSRARGVLVFPSLISAGFIVGGGTGEGTLREGGRSTGYYRMTTVSVGWLAGARSAAVIYLFNTADALQKFKASSGWQVGADASVAVLNVGATARVDTESAQQPITAFVLTNVGLMASAALDGSRITKLDI